MKKLILLILVFLISSCASYNAIVYAPYIPAKTEDAQGKCKEYAIKYHTIAKQNSLESCVVCGILSMYSRPQYHCWNEIKCPTDNKWKLVDLTREYRFQNGWDVKQYVEYMPHIKWDNSVTVKEIETRINYTWLSEVPESELAENCYFEWYPIFSELEFLF